MTLVTLVTRNRALEKEFLELLDSVTLESLDDLLKEISKRRSLIVETP